MANPISVISGTYTVSAGTTRTGSAVNIAGASALVGVCLTTQDVTLRVFQGSNLNNALMEVQKSIFVPANAGAEGRGTPINVPVVDGVECRVDIINQGVSSAVVQVEVGAQMPLNAAYQAADPSLARFVAAPVVLTDAATVALDASLGRVFTLSSALARTLGAPTNPIDGVKICVLLTNSDSVSHLLTLNAIYDVGPFTVTTTLTLKTDLFEFQYNTALTKWLLTNYQKGY